MLVVIFCIFVIIISFFLSGLDMDTYEYFSNKRHNDRFSCRRDERTDDPESTERE